MRGRIAVHSTHEAAERVGNIGQVLAGWLAEPGWRRLYERSLLVGVYPFPTEGSVADDLTLREERGWVVAFDSETPEHLGLRARGVDSRLLAALGQVAEAHGVRLVYGERRLSDTQSVPVLLASPQGLRRDKLDAYRGAVAARQGIDLAAYDGYPALTARVDRRLARVLDSDGALAGRYVDQPERVVVDTNGRPFPGGAGWAAGRAVLPRVSSLSNFSGHTANAYLLELQYHTFAAVALWAGVRAILANWAPAHGGGYDAARVTLFSHDWVGVPLYWAMGAAGDRVAQTVYVAHEARLFRLLAEAALSDRQAVLRAVCHPDGFDAALYPHLRAAIEHHWTLAQMFPGGDSFEDIFYHRINREARKFDRVIAVGPWVADEMRLALRPERDEPVPVVPVGLSTRPVRVQEVADRRERLLGVAERYAGFEPDLIVTALGRPIIYKGSWRVLALVNRLAERLAARAGLRMVCFWLAAPRPRPTRAQIERWSRGFGWPLDHLPAPEGDLQGDETMLWHGITDFNERYVQRAKIFYINQFGWNAGELGALSPGDTTWQDFRIGTDIELDLAVYEPFGYTALESYVAGAVCVLSDACGSARHLQNLGLDHTAVIGRFTQHGINPRDVEDRKSVV